MTSASLRLENVKEEEALPLLRVNVRLTESELRERLLTLRERANVRFAYHRDILQDLLELLDFGEQIVAFAHQYDFRDVQANGFRSLLNLGFKLLEFGLSKTDDGDNITFLKEFARAVASFKAGLKHLQEYRCKTLATLDKEGRCDNQSPDEFFMSRCFDSFLSNADNEAFYGQLWDFSIANADERKVVSVFRFLGCFFSSASLSEAVVAGRSRTLTAKAYGKLMKNIDIYFLRHVDMKLSCTAISERLLPYLIHKNKPSIQKTIAAPRQERWLLDCNPEAQKVRLVDNQEAGLPLPARFQESVSCRYLLEPFSDGELSPGGLLLFNCHGGGYSTSTARTHEIYLRDWAKKFPGLAVLTVDFTLSPKAKFPSSIQEALDVYLWLISGNDSVAKQIGFHPKQIVFNGDSSGGCMVMALLQILNDMKKLDASSVSFFPASLVVEYPSFTSDPRMYASLFMSVSHWILTPPVFANFVEAYVPHNLVFNDNCSHFLEEFEKGSSFKHSSSSRLSSFRDTLSWWTGLEFIRDKAKLKPQAWYNCCDRKVATNYLVNEYKLTRHPYVSPLLYDDFESLSHISLYLIGSDNDPILDQGLLMAKRWQGELMMC